MELQRIQSIEQPRGFDNYIMNLPQDTVKEYLLSALNILQFLGIRVEK